MSDYLPVKADGDEITFVAASAITGGQVVYMTAAGTVATTTAATDAVLGVAAFDAGTGDNVTVYCEGVHELTASGSITAGATVASAASGQVAAFGAGTNYAQVFGRAITSASNGAKVRVLLP